MSVYNRRRRVIDEGPESGVRNKAPSSSLLVPEEESDSRVRPEAGSSYVSCSSFFFE
jgi:hypothetical protein